MLKFKFMASIIEVKNLSKIYSSYKKQVGFLGSIKSLFHREKILVQAVENISFNIGEGELVGFLGPNGAGKTTTLKMLSGILYPSAGAAKVLGYTPWERKKEYQKQFALVMGQKNQLWWDLPARESFLLNKEIYEVPDANFNKTLDELSITLQIKDILDIPVRKLSLGQRMKCELVAALLHDPKVLFLDEPTIGLDVVSQQKIREFILKYNQQRKTTIILTSHYMEDVEALCERVIIINRGQIIYDGNLWELANKYTPDKILEITFLQSVKKEVLEKLGKIEAHEEKWVKLRVGKAEHKKIAGKILQDFPVDDILINEPEIEDVIRDVFTRNT